MARCQAFLEILDVWPIAIWEMSSNFHLAFMSMLQKIIFISGSSYNF